MNGDVLFFINTLSVHKRNYRFISIVRNEKIITNICWSILGLFLCLFVFWFSLFLSFFFILFFFFVCVFFFFVSNYIPLKCLTRRVVLVLFLFVSLYSIMVRGHYYLYFCFLELIHPHNGTIFNSKLRRSTAPH